MQVLDKLNVIAVITDIRGLKQYAQRQLALYADLPSQLFRRFRILVKDENVALAKPRLLTRGITYRFKDMDIGREGVPLLRNGGAQQISRGSKCGYSRKSQLLNVAPALTEETGEKSHTATYNSVVT